MIEPAIASLLGIPIATAVTALVRQGLTPKEARRGLRTLYQAGWGPGAAAGPAVEWDSSAPSSSNGAGWARVTGREASELDPGTVKLVLTASDGARFETVVFRNKRRPERWSLCLSTQAGCRMACPFCATGKAGLTRNLTTAEIVLQAVLARAEIPAGERLTNVVLMGMGEPLDNLDPVLEAIALLHDPAGAGLAADRIVLSTCGHVPGLERLASFPIRIGLAVSLHAANDPLRDRLVPLNRRYPLRQLLETLARHPIGKGKWICFEYVLLAGVNDSPSDARALGPLLAGLRALVQIIPYNPITNGEFLAPDDAATRRFAEQVRAGGVPVAIRSSRGPDIDAACGQLAARVRER